MSLTYCTPVPMIWHVDVLVASRHKVVLAQVICLYIVTVYVKWFLDYCTAADFA